MMNAPVNKPPETASFLDLPVVSNWHGLDADAIIFGAPFGKPYRPTDFPNDQSSAPAALRAVSGRVLLNDQALDINFTPPACFGNLRVVEGGDIPLINDDFARHYSDIEQAMRFAIARDILPVTVGGDDGVTWFYAGWTGFRTSPSFRSMHILIGVMSDLANAMVFPARCVVHLNSGKSLRFIKLASDLLAVRNKMNGTRPCAVGHRFTLRETFSAMVWGR
jgi:hypothetical protein